MRLKLIVTLVACACVAACAGSGGKPKRSGFDDTFPLQRDDDLSLDGNWFNERLGLLVSISALDFALFRRIGPLCWRIEVPEVLEGYRAQLAQFSLLSDQSEIYFRRDRSAPEIRFANLVDLPPGCTDTLSRNEIRTAFRLHLDRQYPYFAKRGVSWQTRKLQLEAATGPIEDDDELYASLLAMVEGLADPLVSLRRDGRWWYDPASAGTTLTRLQAAFLRQTEIAAAADYRALWYDIVRREASRYASAGEVVVALDGAFMRGITPRGAGYIQVSDLTAGTPDAWHRALDESWRAFAETPAIIVDLTMATGGEDGNAIAVASELLRETRVLYRYALNTPGEPDWRDQERDRRSRRPAVPLYVLTSDVTSGEAERVVLAVRGEPGVRQIGTVTRGSMAEPMLLSLPNGWALRLPLVTIADRRDTDYEGVGLAPDFALEFFPENRLSLAHRSALETLDGLIVEGLFDQR